MANIRNTFKYHFKQGNRIVHRGITNDLERRESEHNNNYGSGRIVKVGNKTTREAALKWERNGGKNNKK